MSKCIAEALFVRFDASLNGVRFPLGCLPAAASSCGD